jgi:hypothetical protein
MLSKIPVIRTSKDEYKYIVQLTEMLVKVASYLSILCLGINLAGSIGHFLLTSGRPEVEYFNRAAEEFFIGA